MTNGSRLDTSDLLSRRFTDCENGSEFDVVIVGTGYGGAVAASRIARAKDRSGKPLKIAVLERGKEFRLGEYPTSVSDLPNRVWIDSPAGTAGLEADALFDIRINEGVNVLSGRGLGGTSQINANVALPPDPRVFQDKAWPSAIRANAEALGPYFLLAEEMLQPRPYPTERRELNKLKGLREFYSYLAKNGNPDAEFSRPPLTINFDRNYKHPTTGVKQAACTDCGNCIAGCNEGAKSTLTVNYLQDAKTQGKENLTIFSLCTVTHLLPNPNHAANAGRGSGKRWRVSFRDTGHRMRRGYFDADIVILAGGVLGTTEILLRSRQLAKEQGLRFETSSLLGRRLSSNGDMIGFGYAHQLAGEEDRSLNTVSWEDKETRPGPTITGMIDLRRNKPLGEGIVVQEGATPSAFRWIFEEVIGLTSTVRRTFGRKPIRQVKEDLDRLLPSEAGLRSTQIYLAMGHDKLDRSDSTYGHVELIDDRPRIKWSLPGKHSIYRNEDAILRTSPSALGGWYSANPAWEFLSEDAAKKIGLQESLVGNQVITVHPLGGCCMGDDAREGVVDHAGRVFSGMVGTDVHDGLYICDGSVMPTSLGINPLLTITALAERTVTHMAVERGWTIEYETNKKTSPRYRMIVPRAAIGPSDGLPIEFVETLEGDGYWPPGSNILVRPRFLGWAGERIVRFKVEANLSVKHERPNQKCSDQAFLATCVAGEVKFDNLDQETRGRLGFSAGPSRQRLSVQRYRIGPGGEDRSRPSQVELFGRDGAGVAWPIYFLRRVWHWLTSLPYFWGTSIYPALSHPNKRARVWQVLRQRFPQVWHQLGYWLWVRFRRRGMTYKLWLGDGESPSRLYLEGYKDLSPYLIGDLFEGLVTLQVRLSDATTGKPLASALLKVALNDFLRTGSRGLWEWGHGFLVSQGRDRIASLASLSSTGSYFARAIAAAYYPSFREPTYPAANPLHRPAGRMRLDPNQDDRWLTPSTHWISVPKRLKDNSDCIRLLLTHYRRPSGPSKGPILLLHGFGASSLTFALDIKGQENLTQRLYREGYDVWLLDYRSSIVLPTASEGCTLDDVAEIDIPEALKYVSKNSGGQKVNVLAHCIGAAALMISLLSGHVKLVRSVIFSQVGFVLIGASMNRFKRPFAFFLNRVLQSDMVTAYADANASPQGKIIDRLLSAYPVPIEDTCDNATCRRLTAIYGRIFNHYNVVDTRGGGDCVHDHLHELFGYANTEMFEHISRCFESMTLCTGDGESAWVRRWRIKRFLRMPVLFLHGKDNDVFLSGSTLRSWDLASQINQGVANRYRMIEVAGYGHQDCIVGKHASEHVFPELVEFLEDVALDRFCSAQRYRCTGWPTESHRRGHAEKVTLPDEVKAEHEKLSKNRSFDVQLPFFGPIVGHTTCNSIRVWIRANEAKAYRNERCLGIAWLVKGGGRYPVTLATGSPPIFRRLKTTQNGDCYCVFDFNGLAPDSQYSIVAGTTTYRKRPPEGVLKRRFVKEIRAVEEIRAKAGNSDRRYWATVKTMPCQQNESPRLSFILGSCDHPIDDFGGRVNDEIFSTMRCKLDTDPKFEDVRLMLMVGDQIYADPYERMGFRAKTAREFSSVYAQAFSPYTVKGQMMTRLPTYMILDDHEIEDAWDSTRTSEEQQRLYHTAIDAYRCYQASHGPDRGPGQFWYEFEVCGVPFFVLDTRTEREICDGYDSNRCDGNRLLSTRQQVALFDWLRKHKDSSAPKFIVTPSVLAPDTKAPEVEQDSWARFPSTRRQVLRYIDKHSISNVIFLSGDYHCSTVAKIQKHSATTLAHSVLSSPFHCSVQFVNAQSRDLHHTRTWDDEYGYALLSHPSGSESLVIDSDSYGRHDNFAKIDVCRTNNIWQVSVSYYVLAGNPEKGLTMVGPIKLV
jgi:cholesterol oxidase